jgi:hypothetical protein
VVSAHVARCTLSARLSSNVREKAVWVYVLRARKRSSERMAMPFMKRTATVVVSTVLHELARGFCTVEEASEAEEDHFSGLG